jgi:outer membrane immunogenic protein
LLAATAIGGSVQAADVDVKKLVVEREIEPALSWNGLYVGIHGGWAAGGWDGQPTYDGGMGPVPGVFDAGEIEGDNWLAGVTVGANKQLGQIVLGIEADGSWGDFGGESTFNAKGASAGYAWKIENSLDNLGTLRGRLGYALGPVLVYGTGGIAFGQTSGALTVTADHRQGFTPTKVTAVGEAEENHIGWVAGAGAEWAMGGGWSLKGEWLHIDLGEAAYRLTGTAYPGTPGAFPHTTDSYPSALEFEIFKAGLNFRF